MNMYGNEYNNSKSGKEVKEKENKLNIYKDKSKEDKIFFPSLEIPKEEKERTFTPDFSQNLKQERQNFTPSTEIPKEFANRSFTPDLNIDIKKEQRNFTPSLEMPEKKERTFIPDYSLENGKKPQEKRVQSPNENKESEFKIINWNKEIKNENVFNHTILEHERQAILDKITNENFNYKNIERLVEMITIVLGDGHLHKRGEKSYNSYEVRVSLNRIDEQKYVKYVKSLMEDIFNKKPKIHPRKNSKGVDLKIYDKAIVEWLISLGIKSGNKVENQIFVPKWIKKSKNWIKENRVVWDKIYVPLIKRGLKGLFDTDGSIYIARRDKRLGLLFKNGSLPLVYDFKEMCESLGIKTGKVSNIWEISKKTGKKLEAFYTQIQAKDQIKKFLNLIEPKKWEFNIDKISEKLSDIGIKLEDALNYNCGVYNKQKAKIFKKLYEHLGDFNSVKVHLEQQGEYSLNADTIRNHVKKLFLETDYKKKYGMKGYSIWINNNSSIIIDEKERIVKKVQIGVKRFICREIAKFFLKNKISGNDSLIKEHLKSVIIKSKRERLTYLLTDPEKKNIIFDYFNHFIEFVRHIFKDPKKMEHPTAIWRSLELPFKQKHTFELIEDLKKNIFNKL